VKLAILIFSRQRYWLAQYDGFLILAQFGTQFIDIR